MITKTTIECGYMRWVCYQNLEAIKFILFLRRLGFKPEVSYERVAGVVPTGVIAKW